MKSNAFVCPNNQTASQHIYLAIAQLALGHLILAYSRDLPDRAENSNALLVHWISGRGGWNER